MNRINPLYIGVFLLVVLIMSIYSLNSAKQSLRESKKSFKETQKVADQLSGLKKAYADEKSNQTGIKRLLLHSSLKSSVIKADYKKSGVKILSEDMDKKALDFLMGKLLNSTYDIRKMKIKRLSDEKAELELEIKW
jgi:biopolymer transport protein ExbB/TolQ